MESHNWVYPALSTYTDYWADGSVVSTTEGFQPAREDVVSLSGTTSGDFVTPNSVVVQTSYLEAPSGRVVEAETRYGGPGVREGVCGYLSAVRGFFDLPTGWYESIYNEALDRLNEKVRGSLDLSVDAFQLSQTARMFNLLRTVRSVSSSFRRARQPLTGRDFGDPRAYISTPSGVYLQWKYGWAPLLSSVFGVADELLRQSEDNGFAVRARYSTESPLQPLKAVQLYDNVRVTMMPDGLLRGRQEFKVWMRAPKGAAQLSRFTSLNPVSIAYELVPYSFVLDWFANVGGYLRNLETSLLFNRSFRMGYSTFSTKIEGSYSSMGPTNFKGVIANVGGRFRSTYLHRQRLIQYPSPEIPSFSMDLGSGQLLSAAALLGQRLKPLR